MGCGIAIGVGEVRPPFEVDGGEVEIVYGWGGGWRCRCEAVCRRYLWLWYPGEQNWGSCPLHHQTVQRRKHHSRR